VSLRGGQRTRIAPKDPPSAATRAPKAALWLAAAAVWSCSLGAQTLTTSSITGVVQDALEQGVSGVEITTISAETGARRSVRTGTDGAYSIVGLTAGSYTLTALKDGFSTYVQSGIVLQVNVNPAINIQLALGKLHQKIIVEANASMVETQSAGVGQVVDKERIVDLPLNGRQATQLVTLAGAAVSTFNGANADTRHYPSDSSFSIAGGSRTATNFLLDGASHNDIDNNYGLPLPFPDALQEFKVETNALPANYGNHSGGTINVVTKSGANSVHGDVFEFVRNYFFNARNFFAASRDSLKRNQFGGTAGGPIVRNKLFYFLGYQGTIGRSNPPTNISYVPTAAVLSGDFTQILSPACNGGRAITLKAPYSGNKLSPALFNPVALKLVSLIPVSADPCGRIQYGVPAPTTEHQGIGRVDWRPSDRHTTFGRWFITDYAQPPYYAGNLLTTSTVGQAARTQSIAAGDTFLISAASINTFRANATRSMAVRVNAPGTPTLTALGSNVTSMFPDFTGQIGVSGYFSLGGLGGYFVNNTANIADDFSLTRGAHQILAGVNYVHTQLNGLGPFQMNPKFTFNGSITGNALADLLTGSPASMQQGNGQVAYDRMNVPSLYIQDNWRLARTFTVNFGLRWDPFFPQHHIQNMVSIFEPASFYAGVHSSVFSGAPAGMFFHGDKGFPGESDTFGKLANFAPRAGLVYDPRGRGTEIIRAGYGIFYDSPWTWMMSAFPQNSPWGSTIILNAPSGGLSNPWQGYPGGNPFPTVTPPPANYKFPAAGTYVSMPLHTRPMYMQQWNLALDKQFARNWELSATYLGNKTTHLWLGREINPAAYVPGTCSPGQYGLTAAGPCSSLANINARRRFYLANPAAGQLLGSVSMLDDGGVANYNGLLLSAQHRFSSNFTALVNYTWSHCLSDGDQSNGGGIGNQYQNPSNRAAEYASCTADRRQMINASVIARTPRFAHLLLRRLASEWMAAGIFTRSSGGPLTVTVGTDNALAGESSPQDRPNLVGAPGVSAPGIRQWFNQSAFAKAATGSYGNAGRNTIVGPGQWNLDASVSREFSLKEQLKLHLRAEAFNVFNHARFANPTTAMNSSVFGQINAAADPRILQGAVKVTF